MTYEKIKEEIVAIADIASSVPEQFREKCFEVLLEHLLAGSVEPRVPSPKVDELGQQDPAGHKAQELQTTAAIKAFMRRQSISLEQLSNLVMLEDDEFHFLKEPSHGQARKGQIEWALLLALKNGFLNNKLLADPEDVRSLVQDKGYYDQGNFAANFKHKTATPNFKGILERQGDPQELSTDGEKALAALIRELVGE